jgi:hypothetical protein
MKQIVVAFLLLSTSAAALASEDSYLNPQAFGDCVVADLNLQGGKTAFEARRKDAVSLRKEIKITSKYLQSTVGHLNFVERMIFEESNFAAIQLINSKNPTVKLLSKQMSLQAMLFDLYKEPGVMPVNRPDIAGIVENDFVLISRVDMSNVPQPNDSYLKAMQGAASLANPVVVWLVAQPKGSVSHWRLLSYATNIYGGDVLTALGVIGELFWQETLQASPERNEKAVLASRMMPLVQPATANPVGDNYHFWRIIGAAYYRGGTVLGRIYSPYDSSDRGHLAANKLGLDIASQTFHQMGRNVSCSLN